MSQNVRRIALELDLAALAREGKRVRITDLDRRRVELDVDEFIDLLLAAANRIREGRCAISPRESRSAARVEFGRRINRQLDRKAA
jgi:hypothetical protein